MCRITPKKCSPSRLECKIGKTAWRHISFIVIRIQEGYRSQLFLIAGAWDRSCLVQCRPQSRKDHTCEDRDDGNYDEEFYKCKMSVRFTLQVWGMILLRTSCYGGRGDERWGFGESLFFHGSNPFFRVVQFVLWVVSKWCDHIQQAPPSQWYWGMFVIFIIRSVFFHFTEWCPAAHNHRDPARLISQSVISGFASSQYPRNGVRSG